ncbi:MAG: hypothetical protein QOJ03_1720 [Frankiaceae bacterium]|nr:hypothetical protein [Frankiaceae bacterium]
MSPDREEAATEAITAQAPEEVAVEMEAATQRLREQAWMLNAMRPSASRLRGEPARDPVTQPDGRSTECP